jgi:hypothetical protein
VTFCTINTTQINLELKRGLNCEPSVVQLVEPQRYKPQVACSILDGAIGILHRINLSGRTVALRSTQALTEMSTKDLTWGEGKGGWYVGLTTLPHSCADCMEILGASTS